MWKKVSITSNIVIVRNYSNSEFIKKYLIPSVNKLKLNEFVDWVESRSGYEDVKQSHTSVENARKNYVDIQLKRAKKTQECSNINVKIIDARNKIFSSNKGDPEYPEMLKQECRLLQIAAEDKKQLDRLENLEKNLFLSLEVARNASHEKQKLFSDNLKLFGGIVIIFQVIIGLVVVLYSNKKQKKRDQEQGKMLENIIVEQFKKNSSSSWNWSDLLTPVKTVGNYSYKYTKVAANYTYKYTIGWFKR